MMLIFNGTAIFLSSSYQRYAASAFAVNSVLRYTFAAVFPLFATQSIDHILVRAKNSDYRNWNWLEYDCHGMCFNSDDSYSVPVLSIQRGTQSEISVS